MTGPTLTSTLFEPLRDEHPECHLPDPALNMPLDTVLDASFGLVSAAPALAAADRGSGAPRQRQLLVLTVFHKRGLFTVSFGDNSDPSVRGDSVSLSVVSEGKCPHCDGRFKGLGLGLNSEVREGKFLGPTH